MYLKKLFLFHLSECFPECASVYHICPVLHGDRRGYQIPCARVDRLLWATTWCWDSNLVTLKKQIVLFTMRNLFRLFYRFLHPWWCWFLSIPSGGSDGEWDVLNCFLCKFAIDIHENKGFVSGNFTENFKIQFALSGGFCQLPSAWNQAVCEQG